MTDRFTTYLVVLAVLLDAQSSGNDGVERLAIRTLDDLWSQLSDDEERQAVSVVEALNEGRLSIQDVFFMGVPSATRDQSVLDTPGASIVRTRTPRVIHSIRGQVEQTFLVTAAYA